MNGNKKRKKRKKGEKRMNTRLLTPIGEADPMELFPFISVHFRLSPLAYL